MAFSQDDSLLVSGGLDRNVILWNTQKKSKVKVYEGMDIEVVLTCAFVENKAFVIGGHDCTLNLVNI